MNGVRGGRGWDDSNPGRRDGTSRGVTGWAVRRWPCEVVMRSRLPLAGEPTARPDSLLLQIADPVRVEELVPLLGLGPRPGERPFPEFRGLDGHTDLAGADGRVDPADPGPESGEGHRGNDG